MRTEIHSRVLIIGKGSQVAKDIKSLLLEKDYSDVCCVGRDEAELTVWGEVDKMFEIYHPDRVYCIAARTAAPKDHNTHPWDIMRDNILIQDNVLEACIKHNCKKVIWFSSDSALPYYDDFREITENALFSASVKTGIESYAMAKLTGIQMCNSIGQSKESMSVVSILPCNIYGQVKKGLMYNLCMDLLNAKKEGKREVKILGGLICNIDLYIVKILQMRQCLLWSVK